MEHVDALPSGEPPREPGKIVKATVSKVSCEESRARDRRLGRARREFARQLSKRGHRLVLAARRKDRLEELAKELGKCSGGAIDLSKKNAAAKLLAELEAMAKPSTC